MLVAPVEDAVGALVDGVLLSEVVTHRVWWQRVPAFIADDPCHNSFGIKFRFFRCHWCHSVYAHWFIWFVVFGSTLLRRKANRRTRGTRMMNRISVMVFGCPFLERRGASRQLFSHSFLMTICTDGRYFLTSIIIFLVYVGRLRLSRSLILVVPVHVPDSGTCSGSTRKNPVQDRHNLWHLRAHRSGWVGQQRRWGGSCNSTGRGQAP